MICVSYVCQLSQSLVPHLSLRTNSPFYLCQHSPWLSLQFRYFFWDLHLQDVMDQKQFILRSSHLVENVKSVSVTLHATLCSVHSPSCLWFQGVSWRCSHITIWMIRLMTGCCHGCGDMLIKKLKINKWIHGLHNERSRFWFIWFERHEMEAHVEFTVGARCFCLYLFYFRLNDTISFGSQCTDSFYNGGLPRSLWGDVATVM